MERCEVCGANLQLVGLRHRCVAGRYGTHTVTPGAVMAVERNAVTEPERNAKKDGTAAERMRRYRARERW